MLNTFHIYGNALVKYLYILPKTNQYKRDSIRVQQIIRFGSFQPHVRDQGAQGARVNDMPYILMALTRLNC